jgi:hypothetical protein
VGSRWGSPHRLAAALAAIALSAGSAAGAADAVTTPGVGVLTKCRDWLVYESCNTYHHVALPKRIATGDQIRLIFGSNMKKYTFPVVQIRQHGESCTLLNEHSSADERGEKIVVDPCQPTPQPEAKTP